MRKAFNHYANIHEIKKQLNDKQYLLFDRALCAVQFLEIHLESVTFKDPILTLLWTSIKHTMRSNVEGYCSKMKINYESLFNGLSDTPLLGGYQGGSIGGSSQEEEKGEEEEEGQSEVEISFSLDKVRQLSSTSKKYQLLIKDYITNNFKGMTYEAFYDSCEMKGYKYKNYKLVYDKWNKDFKIPVVNKSNSHLGEWTE